MTEREKEILLAFARERKANADITYNNIKQDDSSYKEIEFDNAPKDEKELSALLGRKENVWIKNLASFFAQFAGVTNIEKPILPLSTRNKRLLALYKTPMSVSMVLKKLQEIGGLKCVSDKIRFNGKGKGQNKCRIYAYNKDVERLVLKIARARKIDIISPKMMMPYYNMVFPNEMEVYKKLRISSKLSIKTDLGDEALERMLSRKYEGLLTIRQMKLKGINFGLPEEQKLIFNWHITRAKKNQYIIRKIGIRATSKIVSLKEHENENPNYRGEWRKQYMANYFYRGHKEYDVRGSIYQVTHLLNFGEWKGDEVDPYSVMYGGEFSTKKQRDEYKSLCMALYFDRPQSILPHNRIKVSETRRKYGDSAINSALSAAAKRMREWTGETLDSEVFFHESLIYVDLLYKLREKDVFNVLSIYDAFYMDIIYDVEIVKQTVKEVAEEYYKEYCIWKKNMGKYFEGVRR